MSERKRKRQEFFRTLPQTPIDGQLSLIIHAHKEGVLEKEEFLKLKQRALNQLSGQNTQYRNTQSFQRTSVTKKRNTIRIIIMSILLSIFVGLIIFQII